MRLLRLLRLCLEVFEGLRRLELCRLELLLGRNLRRLEKYGLGLRLDRSLRRLKLYGLELLLHGGLCLELCGLEMVLDRLCRLELLLRLELCRLVLLRRDINVLLDELWRRRAQVSRRGVRLRALLAVLRRRCKIHASQACLLACYGQGFRPFVGSPSRCAK